MSSRRTPRPHDSPSLASVPSTSAWSRAVASWEVLGDRLGCGWDASCPLGSLGVAVRASLLARREVSRHLRGIASARICTTTQTCRAGAEGLVEGVV